jgi:hypothetical protein
MGLLLIFALAQDDLGVALKEEIGDRRQVEDRLAAGRRRRSRGPHAVHEGGGQLGRGECGKARDDRGWCAVPALELPQQPAAGLVLLEHLGKVEHVVTQNIDGLHQAAGTPAERLVELHGNNRENQCIGCGAREPAGRAIEEFARTRVPPRCRTCGGLLKPAVVMFGEALRPGDLRRASDAAAPA